MRLWTLRPPCGRTPFRILLVLGTFAVTMITATSSVAEQAEISGTSKVYLRSGPGADYPTVGILDAGEKVTIVSTQGVWSRVATADSRVGYLNRRFITALDESQAGATRAPEAVSLRPAEGTSSALSPTPSTEAQRPELSSEMAALRSEVSELKQRIEEQRTAEGTETRHSAAIGLTPLARTPPVAIQTGNDPVTAREQGIGVLAVAMLCLIIGWVLGSTFTRRRSRSQRSRLRF